MRMYTHLIVIITVLNKMFNPQINMKPKQVNYRKGDSIYLGYGANDNFIIIFN